MREILFRGKDTETCEWIYGSLIHVDMLNGESFTAIIQPEEKAHPMRFPYMNEKTGCIDGYADLIDPASVGQFTGLTDENGKKIFEGDIVKCRHRVFQFSLEDLENINPRRSYGKETEENVGCGVSLFYWRNYAVSFRDGHVRIQNGSDNHEIRANYIYNHKIEVIGNIHDNPELLKGGIEDGT